MASSRKAQSHIPDVSGPRELLSAEPDVVDHFDTADSLKPNVRGVFAAMPSDQLAFRV